MVAFWVDEELERGVEVTVRLADGTDVIGGIVVNGLRSPVAHHRCGWLEGVGGVELEVRLWTRLKCST